MGCAEAAIGAAHRTPVATVTSRSAAIAVPVGSSISIAPAVAVGLAAPVVAIPACTALFAVRPLVAIRLAVSISLAVAVAAPGLAITPGLSIALATPLTGLTGAGLAATFRTAFGAATVLAPGGSAVRTTALASANARATLGGARATLGPGRTAALRTACCTAAHAAPATAGTACPTGTTRAAAGRTAAGARSGTTRAAAAAGTATRPAGATLREDRRRAEDQGRRRDRAAKELAHAFVSRPTVRWRRSTPRRSRNEVILKTVPDFLFGSYASSSDQGDDAGKA